MNRIVLYGFFGVLATTAIPFVLAAQEGCTLYKVDAPILDVRKNAEKPGDFIDILEGGDIACVTRERNVGGDKVGYVKHKTPPGGQETPVNGWVGLRYLVPQPKDAASASAGERKQAAGPKPATPPAAQDDGLRFDQPVQEGPYPVRGKSLQELVQGQPMFSPMEGLDENLWQKPCTTCHQWNQERLCEQGASYIKSAKAIFRHQHPYGGPYKLALMRWAKAGCK